MNPKKALIVEVDGFDAAEITHALESDGMYSVSVSVHDAEISDVILIALAPERLGGVASMLLQSLPRAETRHERNELSDITDLDSLLDEVLFRLDHGLHMKRACAAKAALKYILAGNPTDKLSALYDNVGAEIGCNRSAAERLLRNFAHTVRKNRTVFCMANKLHECPTNGSFYFQFARVVKQMMDKSGI